MSRLVLRGLLTRKLRTVLTSLAILLGVAMITGTFVLVDQINRAFNDIFQTAYAGTDVLLSHQTKFTGQQTQAGPLPASVIQEASRVPGVAKAEGQIQALGAIVKDGKYLGSQGGAPSLAFSAVDKPFDSLEVVDGHEPQASGEVAINKKLADDHDLHVGDHVGLATERGVVPVTISGIVNYGNVSSIGGATIVVTTFPDAQRWFDREGKTSLVLVQAQAGVSPGELKQRLRAALPPTVKVQTGEEAATEQSNQINDAIGSFLTPALLAFAGAAVFVGAFIIFNTFSITVAQRMREFALTRTLGATRRQVLRSVLGEAFVVGLLASVIGIVGGLLFARGMVALFDAIGFGLPTASSRLTPNAVVTALIVGVGVTVLASFVPARRATRVPPIAALREGAELPPSRAARFAPYIAAALTAVGLLIVLQSVFRTASASQALLGLALGAILVFFGVALVSRYIVRPLAAAIGWPLQRLAPASGTLARENAMRNPSRTAVTSAALMIGLGLVVFVAVFAAGIKRSFTSAVETSVTANLIVSTQNQGTFPARAATIARHVQGVETVSPIYEDFEVHINQGGTDTVNGIDPATLARTYHFDWQKGGSDGLLTQLGYDGALVEKNFAKSHNLEKDDTFRVTGIEGRTAVLHVVGEYKDPVLLSGVMVPISTFRRVSPVEDPSFLTIRTASGTDEAAVDRGVTHALAPFPTAKVQTRQEYLDQFETQLNQLLYLLYALLAMSVVISLFGIVNTLALSVFERTREIGMLRAIGTTRRQLRRMIRWESVITCIIGGLLGVTIGVVFAWIVSRGLSDQGIEFALPVGQLVVSLIVAAFAGVLAAVLPARRAARLNVLDALHYE